ncbi:MAG: hypothetical protein ACRC6B_11885 [Fusobacteriaceae bacterium]
MKNLLSVEVAPDVEAVANGAMGSWMDEYELAPKPIRDYVQIPFILSYTNEELKKMSAETGIPIPTCKITDGHHWLSVLEQRLKKAYLGGKFQMDVAERAKHWSRDGKTIQLYSGIPKGEPYLSWTVQPCVAYAFAAPNGYTYTTDVRDKEMEVRIMTVPLDRLNEMAYWMVYYGGEVMLDVDSPTFKEFWDKSVAMDPQAFMEEYYADYVVPEYDCQYPNIPEVPLKKWNEYPYNLTYPPYPY